MLLLHNPEKHEFQGSTLSQIIEIIHMNNCKNTLSSFHRHLK